MSLEDRFDEVRQLIIIGKEKGYLLYDEVNDLLPADLTSSPEDLDELICGPGSKALGRVVQRARVDVDEAGTRAAATTAVTARAVAFRHPEFHIVFDRPFTWAVEHAPTGTILFCGRVLNPTERSD